MKKLATRFLIAVIVCVFSATLVLGCSQPAPAPTSTPTAKPTATSTPTATPTATSKPTTSPTPTATAKQIVLKLNCASAPEDHKVKNSLIPFAQAVEKRTNGAVKFELYYLDQLGKSAQTYDLNRTGVSDIATMPTSYAAGRFPLTDIGALAGLFATGEEGAKAMTTLLKSGLLDKEYNDTHPFGIGSTSPNQLFLAKKRTQSLPDIAGLKVRVPGGDAVAVWKALGALPISLASGELYQAMATGTVDGSQFTLATAKTFKLDEVSKYILMVRLGTTMNIITMNLDKYKSLSPDIQKILDEEGEKASINLGISYDNQDVDSTAYFKSKGTELIEPTDMSTWLAKVAPLHKEWIDAKAKAGLPGQQVYDKVQSILKDLRKK